MTAAKNIKKCIKYLEFKNIPEFRTLWETYENDPYPKKGKKKAGKKKGKWLLLFLFFLSIYVNIFCFETIL